MSAPTAVKALGTYLRSTAGDSRLNDLMMLHVHKDGTDAPTFVDMAYDFAGKEGNRKKYFRSPPLGSRKNIRARLLLQFFCPLKKDS